MTGSSRVDVVVPVYGGWKFVEQCMQALSAQTIPVTVIVVDDRSPDDTVDRIRGSFPDVRVVENVQNRGFAYSCNAGIAAGDGEFVVLINSDVIATPDMAASIVEAFDSDVGGGSGSVSPILIDSDGLVDSFGITADRTIAGFVRFHGARPDEVDADTPTILGPYGAAAAYRRSALEEVGPLDDNIFMYGEELDLALRLRSAGWDALALSQVVGTHIGGGSAGKGSARQRYLSAFGRGYLLRVYHVLRTRHGVQAAVIELLVCVVRLLSGDVGSVRGRWDGWRRGSGVPGRSVPTSGLDRSIGVRTALAIRKDGYWSARED